MLNGFVLVLMAMSFAHTNAASVDMFRSLIVLSLLRWTTSFDPAGISMKNERVELLMCGAVELREGRRRYLFRRGFDCGYETEGPSVDFLGA